MKTLLISILLLCLSITTVSAQYDRNKAIPVEKVLFGNIESVRNISQEELVEDSNNGWRTFGGALIGGAIGHQFGGGSGQDVATVLGAIIGGSMANNRHRQPKKIVIHLVELMIITNDGERFMVIQDFDNNMVFQTNNEVRLVYLENGSVRVDKSY
jgi:outer membrane lipoprotein SlyB